MLSRTELFPALRDDSSRVKESVKVAEALCACLQRLGATRNWPYSERRAVQCTQGEAVPLRPDHDDLRQIDCLAKI